MPFRKTPCDLRNPRPSGYRLASKAERAQLRTNFVIAVTHFDLCDAAIEVAWDSAMRNPGKASVCYGAIARSL